MAYKFQIGKFKTAGEIDVSEGDIDLNSEVVDNDDLAGNITSDKMAKFEDGEIVFSGDADAFVSSETAKHNMDTEIAARTAGDSTLQGNIDTEAGLREAGDQAVQDAIDAEVIRAQTAEGLIQDDVDANEAATNQGFIDAGADRAAIRTEFADADTALSGAVADSLEALAGDMEQLEDDLEAADATLQSNIDVEKARIDAILEASDADKDSFAEIVTLINSVDLENDQALAAAVLSINTAIADVQADVDQNELDSDAAHTAATTDRGLVRSEFAAADTALQGNIDALSGAVDSRMDQIESDTEAGFNAAGIDRGAIRTEFADADALLAGDIQDEEDARIAADTALSNSITDLSSAVESDLEDMVSDFEADVGALQSEIDAEEVRATTAEAALQGNIDSEETARIAGDLAESNARTALSGALNTRIDNEVSDLEDAIEVVQSDVDANELAANTRMDTIESDTNDGFVAAGIDRGAIRTEFADADALIQADVDANELAASNDRVAIRGEFAAADTTLQGNIDALSGAVSSDLASLAGDLDSEVEDLEAAIGVVQADVDANEAATNQGFIDAGADRAAIRTEFADADTALSGAIADSLESLAGDMDQMEDDLEAAIGVVQADVDANELAAFNDRAAIREEFANADTALQGAIDVEKGRIDTLLAGADVDFDTLKEIADAYQLADTSIIDTITALQSDVDQNEADGDTDRALIRSEFAAADTALQGNIDALSGAVAADFASLDASLSDEVEELEDAIAVVQADVDANELAANTRMDTIETNTNQGFVDAGGDRAAIRTEFADADTALSGAFADSLESLAGDMDQMEDDLEAAIGVVQADVDANELAASNDRGLIRSEFATADTTLQGNIDALSGAVSADLATLAGDMDQMEDDLEAAIGVVQADVDANELAANSRMDTIETNTNQGFVDAGTDRAAIRTEFADADTALANDMDDLESEMQGQFDAIYASKSITGDDSADSTVHFISAAGGNVVVAVPAGSMQGEFKRIKRTDDTANSVTLSGDIEGNVGGTVTLNGEAAVLLVWDSAMWWIM